MLENSINSICAFIQKPECIFEESLCNAFQSNPRLWDAARWAARPEGASRILLPLTLGKGWESNNAVKSEVSLPPLGRFIFKMLIYIFEEFSCCQSKTPSELQPSFGLFSSSHYNPFLPAVSRPFQQCTKQHGCTDITCSSL